MTALSPYLFSLALPYIGFMSYLLGGILRIRPLTKKNKNFSELVSVIIPLRNEEAHVHQIESALLSQDFPGQFEIICVNDRSTDRTHQLLSELSIRHPCFRIINISADEPSVPSPKKRALERGIQEARGEIIVTTDADCVPPKGWLKSMISLMDSDTGIVQGPKHIDNQGSWIHHYQSLEMFGFVCIEASTFAWGKPLLASAPSLAYRKSLYLAIGGFSGMDHLVSGDDDMLVHKMTKLGTGKVKYNFDPAASVKTSPVNSWRELTFQRSRWSSNGLNYPSIPYILFLTSIYLYYLSLVFVVVLGTLGVLSWIFVLVYLGIKFCLDGIFLGLASRKFQYRGVKHLIWVEWVHIPIICIAVLFGLFGWYRWKP